MVNTKIRQFAIQAHPVFLPVAGQYKSVRHQLNDVRRPMGLDGGIF